MALMEGLDSFIGLLTIYLILSLIVSAVGEGISTWTRLKGRILKRLLASLLGPETSEKFLEHESIVRLREPAKFNFMERIPSYIPDKTFADTLIDLLINPNREGRPVTVMNVDRAIAQAPFPEIDTVMKMLWQQAGFDLEAFKTKLIEWFNATGDRSIGWFRRQLGFYLFALGFVIAVALNADTLYMFEMLSQNESLRQAYVERATEIVETTDFDNEDSRKRACRAFDIKDKECAPESIIKHSLPELLPVIGWDQTEASRSWVLKVFGWLLTAAAVSLGAPFWFDLLQKIVNVRKSLQPTKSTTPEAEGIAPSQEPKTAAVPTAKSIIRSRAQSMESLTTLMGFAEKRFGFEPLNLFWCARLSALAYATGGQIEAELEQWDAEGILLETPVTDTQCILAHTPKAAFLAFRGTEQKLADWLTDFEIKPRTPSWNGSAGYLVHSGFNEALDSIWPKIMTALAETEVLARGLPLWLTGHSLGGALAALGGLRMTEELETAESSTVIAAVFAYGQPRVGDRACAEAFDRALPNRYFRSINHRDVVARIPLPRTPDVLSKIQSGSGLEVYDYAHAGRVIFFNDVGQALMDPPLWYRKLDALPVAENVRALKNILKETTGDHAMSGYVALHRQLLETATPESATSGL